MGRRVAIVGIGQTLHKKRHIDRNHTELINEAARKALQDAEITIEDVDAVLNGNMDLFEGHNLMDAMTVEGSGAYMKPGLKMNTGGTTGGTMVASGWYHVASGKYDVVLIIGSEKLEESGGNTTSAIITCADPLTLRPYHTGAVGALAIVAASYMNQYRCGEEPGAIVRVKAAGNALKNPYSHLKLTLTVDDVLDSAILIWPLRLLHMCPQSSGACAIVLASEEKAKKMTKKPVWITDFVTSHMEAWRATFAPDPIPSMQSQTDSAIKLFKRNGITNPMKQVDMFEMYDPAAWAEIAWLEDFLICEKGEAWKLAEKGVTALDGAFPVNPSGGVQSTNPIGATAMIRVAEAALQIRGDAGGHQVTKNVNSALASSFGGANWTNLFLLKKNLD
ncbi:MAG: thiolase family protein [Chloroflexi bacterium]|nr:thiolase family protein [Chloroflexota bacterium]